jgi:ligand-binding sensor domain-containing protein
MGNRQKINKQLSGILPALLICSALQGQYYFDKLTEENGLSDNRITCFLKDKTGFLWIGTKNGLNRYDGNLFKAFRPTRTNSISSEEINDIAQDSSGKLWVATMIGLNMYDPLTNRWETLMPVNSQTKNDLPNYLIWDLYVDEQNLIWIVSDVWELSVYDPVLKKFTYYDWPAVKKQKQFANISGYRSIQKIIPKSKNEFWLATTIGLFSVNRQSGQFLYYGSGYHESVKDFQYDSENKNVFLVTETGRIFCYNENDTIYREIQAGLQPYPAVGRKKKKNQNENLLLAHPEGMLEIHKLTRKSVIIRHQPNLSSTLLPGGTNSVYTDNTGMLWAGTNVGICFCNRHNQVADFIPLLPVSDKEATDGMSAALYDSIDNRYYITSLASKELFVIDGTTGFVTSINSADGRFFSACTNICTDNETNIWLLTETNIYRYNRLKKTFSLFPTPNGNEAVIFHDLLQDKKGNYWLATWGDGLYRYHTKEKIWERFADNDSINARSITALHNDPLEPAVWVGTYNYGIYRFDLNKNNFINYTESEANPDYLQLVLTRDLEADATGKLWLVMTGAGLYRYRHGFSYESSFTHFTAKNGLPYNSFFSITADNKSRLWLLSGKKITAIDTSGNFLYDATGHPAISFSNYIPNLNFPKRIDYNDKENELLVPVAGGLLIYYPDKTVPVVKYPVVLTDMFINGHSVFDSLIRLPGRGLEVPFHSNTLSFQFAALSFNPDNKIRYEYKLNNSEAEWKSIGISNTLNFPDMPPGKYQLMVRARDAAGSLSSNIFSYSFSVIPPFWRMGWFYTLVAALIGTTIFFVYRYQLNKKLELERLRLRIARDLHDDIGSALTSINVLSKVAMSKGDQNKNDMNAYLAKINESSSFTMESMSDIVWAINPKNDKLDSLISRMKEFAADVCEAKGIELVFCFPPELETLALDISGRKNLFLVFKEAMNNAVKYSNCRLLKIEFEKRNNNLTMRIRDNGAGFNNNARHNGNGLENMAARAAECGGILRIETEPNQGTIILMEIPVPRIGVLKK